MFWNTVFSEGSFPQQVVSAYLISRFLLMSKQTSEFPTISTMASMERTVVMAKAADSDIEERCYFRDLDRNKTTWCLVLIFDTLEKQEVLRGIVYNGRRTKDGATRRQSALCHFMYAWLNSKGKNVYLARCRHDRIMEKRQAITELLLPLLLLCNTGRIIPARCLGVHGLFDSRRGPSFFSLTHARDAYVRNPTQ